MFLLDVDPSVIQPGWGPLVVTLLLAGVMVLLFLSMRRQFRKINIGQDAPGDDLDAPGPPADQPR